MPHHHPRYAHAHAHAHAHVQEKRQQDVWDKITSKAASVFNDAFPTANKQQSTSYRTVYVTMTPSGFTGGPLSTMKPTTATAAVAPPVKATATSTPSETLEVDTTTSKAPTTTRLSTSSKAAPTSSDLSEITSVSSDSIPSTLAVAPTTTPTTFARQASTSAASTPSATPSSDAAKSGETSGAAKAGIAIGVLAGVLVLGLVIFFLFTRRRKQVEEEQKRVAEEDEKRNGPFSDVHAIPGTPTPTTPAQAPRLSFRPGSQFLPNLNTHPDRRASRGANMAMTLSPAQNTSRNLAGNGMQQPSMSNPNNNSANPFGNHAERMHAPIPEEEARPVSPLSPVYSDVGTAITTDSPPRHSPIASSASNNATFVGVGAAAAGVAAAGVAVGMARKTSIQRGNAPKALDITRRTSTRANTPDVGNLTRKASLRKDTAAPQPLDLTMPPPLGTVPPSPAGTEFSFNSVAPGQSPGPSDSAAAIAAAGGPPQSTVHRVQLDFKPTMEDELELRAGQLVRLLHEYDDGWALCIRLDRSSQGVVPRTCLSTRPVKPRPAPGGGRPGPPVNPNRGPGPMNRPPQGGSNGGPPYPRPESAQSRRNSPPGGQQYPRPGSAQSGRQSPAGGYPMPRSQSPGPRYQQPRPQSPSGMNRRMSPPGQSPMSQQYASGPATGPVERKPVPGQAS